MSSLCGAPTSTGAPCRNKVASPGVACGRCRAQAYRYVKPPMPEEAAPPPPHHRAATKPKKAKATRRRGKRWFRRSFMGVRPGRAFWNFLGVTPPWRRSRGFWRFAETAWDAGALHRRRARRNRR